MTLGWGPLLSSLTRGGKTKTPKHNNKGNQVRPAGTGECPEPAAAHEASHYHFRSIQSVP